MKSFLFTALACLFASCSATTKPKAETVKAQGKTSYEYRLVYSNPPYSEHEPQIQSMPDGAVGRLAGIWEKARGLEPSEVTDSRRNHSPTSYMLEGSDGGEWQFLSLVDREGELLKVDGSTEVSWLTDDDASRLLRKQIRAMEQERGTSVELRKVSQPERPATPEVIVLKKGFVKSPFDPAGRPVDVRDLPSGTEVEDPYVQGKTFFVP